MNKNILNSVPVERQRTNVFDLSHDLKFSFNMGELVPTTILDVVPGDSFTIGFENLLRFSALIAPVMHKIKVTTHYFFVPNRIIWAGWEKWITGQVNDEEPPYFIPNNVAPLEPGVGEYGVSKGSLCDYMGIPPVTIETPVTLFQINALPFAAYWKIFHEYYMDQNNDPDFEGFQPYFNMIDGDNSLNVTDSTTYFESFAYDNATKIGYRAWQHDYFTSALPWAQKGDDVLIPLSNMTVEQPFIGGDPVNGRFPIKVFDLVTGAPITGQDLVTGVAAADLEGAVGPAYLFGQGVSNIPNAFGVGNEPDGTITNLRRAFALQSWLEKNARGGTRYTESILVHFGVRSSDSRLQRPEYLGGSVQNMVISEVLSTAQTLDSSDVVVNPVGQMSGHGVSVGGSRVLRYYAEEHGWIIGLISVMPDTAYSDGIARKFTRFDRYEYFWPSFQHIGEQAIRNRELLAAPEATDEENEATFGYVPRYTEYKYESSRVAGDFRDNLDFWHLGRKFIYDTGVVGDGHPALNANFIYPKRWSSSTEEDPFNRIFAVSGDVADTIYAHTLNIIKARRPMALYGIPSI